MSSVTDLVFSRDGYVVAFPRDVFPQSSSLLPVEQGPSLPARGQRLGSSRGAGDRYHTDYHLLTPLVMQAGYITFCRLLSIRGVGFI
jgi:hypothetical protein